MSYQDYWKQISEKNDDLSQLISSYWNQYSDMGNWQFWLVLAFLLLPLILLYFLIDRKRIFEIFFFGYTVHILWTYIDQVLANYNYFIHTYFLSPWFPPALSMTASALPVGFLLVYQYCTNHNKNFYFYSLLLSAVFAFVFATIEEYIGLVKIERGMNQFYIFLIDIAIVYTSYWFTKLMLKFRERKMN
ncbi:hypothetical protein DYI25_13305 [Mesobacillus boroniphilus]|uniref:Uncharacterized protein n=1 Tax=Mesobacillus boroniphilus TaxID=308892 RepID=A0A944CLZ4_9BACI|nr:hypothetical protein [Mesobacillus boroniphilus]MBS8265399.1 hypothetical protein [Mesobacillus boroniphilus]